MAKTSKLNTETKKIWEKLKVANWANSPLPQPVYLSNWMRCVNSVAYVVVVPVKIWRKRKTHLRLKIDCSVRVPTHRPMKSFQMLTIQPFAVIRTHTHSDTIPYDFANINLIIKIWFFVEGAILSHGKLRNQIFAIVDTNRHQTHTHRQPLI